MSDDPILKRLEELEGTLPDPELGPSLATAIFERSPDAQVIVEKGGVIRFVNRRLELLTGYHRSEIVGEPVEILVPKHQRETHIKDREEYTKEPHIRPMGLGLVLNIEHKDGTRLPVAINLSPVVVPEGMFIIATIRRTKETEPVAIGKHGHTL